MSAELTCSGPPDVDGLKFWVERIAIQGRDSVRVGFAVSNEFAAQVGLPQRYQHLVNDISSSDGKLMLVDVVIPPGRDPHSGKFIDLNMLVMTGGLERAERSFASFLEASGFRLVRVVKTRLPNQHS